MPSATYKAPGRSKQPHSAAFDAAQHGFRAGDNVLQMMNLATTADSGGYHRHLGGTPGAGGGLLDRRARRRLCARRVEIVNRTPPLGLAMPHSSFGNVAGRLRVARKRRFAGLRNRGGKATAVWEVLPKRKNPPLVALEHAVLLLDEPKTRLDFSEPPPALDMPGRLQHDRRITKWFVSHDMGVIRTEPDQVTAIHRDQFTKGGVVRQIQGAPSMPAPGNLPMKSSEKN